MGEVRTVGVVGAGQMGRGIAQVAAAAGYAVRLLDAAPGLAEAARASIDAALERQVARGQLAEADRVRTVEAVQAVSAVSALADADLVIEAVPEALALKLRVLAEIEAVLRDDAVLASNTSSLSITQLAAACRLPQRVAGMHFMNPAPAMALVELVVGAQTDEATASTVRAVAERMGKTVVAAQDSPGFVVNRLLIPFLNEACFALQEGLATPEELDAAVRVGLNHPMGPLALADLIGLDTVLAIAEVLHGELGDKYRPAGLLRRYVAAGWLGRKSGRGFFEYARRT